MTAPSVHRGRRAVEHERRLKRERTRLVGGALVLVVLVVAAIVVLRPAPTPPIPAEGRPFLGAADAPVTAFLFIDYQCPACAAFETGGGLDDLRAKYTATGSVRVVVMDFPFIGEDSWHAAVASGFVWANAPDSWAEWSQGLFRIQGAENSGWARPAALVQYSSTFSEVDAVALRAALGRDDRAEARASLRDGQTHGVTGTPTLVVNDKALSALNGASVTEALDEAIRAAGGSS